MIRVRCFFAIRLTEAAKESISVMFKLLHRDLKALKLRWIPVDNLHITLCFLGTISKVQIEALIETAGNVLSVEPFTLHLGAPLWFPSPRKARVLALPVCDHNDLSALVSSIQNIVVAKQLEISPRPFRGHLTLARVKSFSQAKPSLEETQAFSLTMPVSEVILYQSVTHQTGAVYTPLAVFPQ